MLCLLLISFLALSWQRFSTELQQAQQYRTQMLAQTTETTLSAHESLLATVGYELISLNADIDPESGRAYIDSIHDINPVMAGFGLARIDGQLVLVSKISKEKALPNLLESSVTARSFTAALERNQLVTGQNYYQPLLSEWVLPIRAPIKDETGLITAVMTAGYRLSGERFGIRSKNSASNMELRLLRSDGYWQYTTAKNESSVLAIYREPISKFLLEQISQIAKGKASAIELDIAGRQWLVSASYIPEYQLYSVGLQSVDTLFTKWWDGVYSAVLLMGVALFLIALGIRSSWLSQRELKLAEEEAQEKLYIRANFSALTGLANRNYIYDQLLELINQADKKQTKVTVALLDIDSFRDINSVYGQVVGDRVLSKVARNIVNIAGSHAKVGHLGADEFLIIWPNAQDQYEDFLVQLASMSPSYFKISQQSVYVSACTGSVVYPDNGESAPELLNNADLALSAAKQKGRSETVAFNRSQAESHKRILDVESQLRRAFKSGELSLCYQPKYKVGESCLYGVEALLRWTSKELGFVSPVEFIPVAERSGLIEKLTDFVLSQALVDIEKLRNVTGLELSVAINVSVRDVMMQTLSLRIQEAMEGRNLPTSAIEVELTESLLAEDIQTVKTELDKLRDLGVSIAIDDFGTGYSSMSYLSQITCDRLKIDRAFVKSLADKSREQAITAAIVTLGHSLDLTVIAEGVETLAQYEQLSALGCDEIQGYLKSKPLSLADLEKYCQQFIS